MRYIPIIVHQQPNIALQRTPLARPLGWARCLVAVPCRRSSRSLDVASSAAESWRWAATAARAIFNTNKTKNSVVYSHHLSIVLLPRVTSYISIILQSYYYQAERFVFPSSFNCTTTENNVVYFNHPSIVLLPSRALRIPVIFQLIILPSGALRIPVILQS